MLEYLKDLKDKSFDIFYFIPGENENELEIQLSNYVDPGERIDYGGLGDMYDIITFRVNDNDDIDFIDRFDGILLCPFEYASTLIPQKWYGVFLKKTTTSDGVAKRIVDRISKP